MHASEPAPPLVRDLVLVGGGHSHVHVLKMLGMQPIRGVQVTLITRDVMTPYSGMLPGHVAGHYTRDQCHIDLRKIARFAGARLVHASATGLDRERKEISCSDGRPPITYDICSVDIGSTPRLPAAMISASEESRFPTGVTAVKPIDWFSRRWDQILERVRSEVVDAKTSVFRLVVVGGGAGGVELALAMHHRLNTELKAAGSSAKVQATIVHRGQSVLSGHNARVRSTFMRILAERGIGLRLGVEATDARNGSLALSDGQSLPYDEAVWCTPSGAAAWLRETGLKLHDGFIVVNDFLQSTNDPSIFACGDCAHMENHPRPKAGVFAVRQGPPLTVNLRSALCGQKLQPYIPQKDFLSIVSAGDRYAVASRGKMLSVEGGWVWRWKDRIDVKWMLKYQELPNMIVAPPLPPPAALAAGKDSILAYEHSAMRCGGCGGKIGSDILSRVLSRLGDGGAYLPEDAALIPLPPAGQGEEEVCLIQTTDNLRECGADTFLFGRISALHALADIYAMGGKPIFATATAVVPFAGEGQVQSMLMQLMGGAMMTLKEADCQLVGGHSSEGADMALGLAVTGTVPVRKVLKKGNLNAGDVLILTKPIGTGVLLATEMRGKANASWVTAALDSMLLSNRGASEVLVASGVRAATDVTGFGLMGHLIEMIKASSSDLVVRALHVWRLSCIVARTAD
jgi:selenide,water dikinase